MVRGNNGGVENLDQGLRDFREGIPRRLDQELVERLDQGHRHLPEVVAVPRTHGEEMISRRVVGGSDQSMLEVMRRAFFQDVEESAVIMLSHPPKGTRDEWIEVPLPGLGEIGIQVHRKERVKLFDTEKEGYEGTKRTIAWSGLWVDLSPRKGRREKYENGKWVGYTIFKKS